ncbi:MAG TPA: enoyl-ACP reductase [Candidatus Omnitrophota bacterium]|nr:enoyl-ACP reductase [Candidatus Omnitrophota bacterium]
MLLEGKNALILGVANQASIAWAIAKAFSREGANLAFAYQGERLKENLIELTGTLPHPSPVFQCDVTKDDEIQNLFSGVRHVFGRLDVLVHSIAFAPKNELSGRISDTTRQGFQTAQEVSAYSLLALAKGAEALMEGPGGSILAMSYIGAVRVIPNYNLMGPVKASLEAEIRYLAYDLGPKNIRVNGISAGPVNTVAARGISRFGTMLKHHAHAAPLRRNVGVDEIANTAVFLASTLSSGITGEILYCDCGYHIMGM